jgi:hypothetical protein
VAIDIVLGLAVLALLIWRQLSTRPVSDSGLRLIVILLAIGLVEAGQFVSKNHAGTLTYAAIVGSLLIAALFGALRAATVKIWRSGGQAWSKGNWLTALLWVAAVAAHLGYDALVADSHGPHGLGNATLVLYLAISLGFQRVIVQYRANRLVPAVPAG